MTSYKHQEQTLDRYIKNSGKEPEFLTLKQAAKLLNKSVHNISYLIAYKRINKYDSLGRKKAKVGKGGIYVSKSELLQYWDNWQNQLKQRRESLNIKNVELAFYDLSEKERTKHIHRLHPYLGKFIPQLVEHYVVKNFTNFDKVTEIVMALRGQIEENSEYYRSNIIDWEVVADDYLTEFERMQLDYDGEIRFFAKELTILKIKTLVNAVKTMR